MKSEPGAYSWDDLVRDGQTYWDGVRNYESRNNMRAMAVGDIVLYYHSGKGPAVVGIAEVVREHYQDPTTEDIRWSVVDIKPIRPLHRPVTLAEIKRDPKLSEMQLVRRSRLSVTPVAAGEFLAVLELSETDPP